MQTRRLFLAVPAAFAFVDWPQWRGPNRDGSTPPEPSPKAWPERLRQVWNIPVGIGHSSPVVAGPHVFQFARLNEQEVVAAYEINSGKALWKQTYNAPYQMNPAAVSHGKGPKATPALAGGRLYTIGIHGVISCWEAASGKRVWTVDTKGSPDYGQAASPVIDRGTL